MVSRNTSTCKCSVACMPGLTGVGRLLTGAEAQLRCHVEVGGCQDGIMLQRMHVIHAHALFACMKTER